MALRADRESTRAELARPLDHNEYAGRGDPIYTTASARPPAVCIYPSVCILHTAPRAIRCCMIKFGDPAVWAPFLLTL